MKRNSEKIIQSNESKSLIDDLRPLINQFGELATQAYQIYKPLVEVLIRSQTKDDNKIQHTLDHILDFCFDDQMLLLYKSLCRYYWDINPVATADYVNYYREMWDSDKPE